METGGAAAVLSLHLSEVHGLALKILCQVCLCVLYRPEYLEQNAPPDWNVYTRPCLDVVRSALGEKNQGALQLDVFLPGFLFVHVFFVLDVTPSLFPPPHPPFLNIYLSFFMVIFLNPPAGFDICNSLFVV